MSSMVYLNNAFHLSLFFASLEKKYIRIPRFMVLDGIENGGMEDLRSKNFQKLIADKLKLYKTECQILVATKSIDPSLDNISYLVGSTYTKNNKSLDM